MSIEEQQRVQKLIAESPLEVVRTKGQAALDNNDAVKVRYWLAQDSIRAASRNDLVLLTRHIPVEGLASFEFGDKASDFYCAMGLLAALNNKHERVLNYFVSHSRFKAIRDQASLVAQGFCAFALLSEVNNLKN